MPRLIERLLVVLVSFTVAIGVIALLSGGLLAGHDTPGIAGTADGPGVGFRDQGNTLLAPGAARPAYDSDPPTSGPHRPVGISRDGAALSDDQILQALAAGDVVVLYGDHRPPPGLDALARALAPPFTAALSASGQAIVLGSRAGTQGIVAIAWAHLQRVNAASDPALRTFIQFWLGRGVSHAPAKLPKT